MGSYVLFQGNFPTQGPPALAGRFFTTEPRGKPSTFSKFQFFNTVLTAVTMSYITSSDLTPLTAQSLYRFTNLSLSPLSLQVVATFLLSVSMSLTFYSDSTYLFHVVCVFIWLISLSIMPLRSIYGVSEFFSFLNNIPLCVCHILYPFFY